jgi:hypothetical protein
MNAYQKAATFVLRIVGCVLTVVGATGPSYVLCVGLISGNSPQYPLERWVASIVWTAGGVVLVLLSKLIGRLLGHGLD